MNNLIERIIGMLPEGVELTIRNGRYGKVGQTTFTLESDKKKLISGIKWPHTDDEFYLAFIDTLTAWNK